MKSPLVLIAFMLISVLAMGQKMVKEIEKKFENGKPEVISYYRDAVSTNNLAKRETYSADGKKSKEENFLNGKLNGKVQTWKEFDGTIISDLNYANGLMEGPQRYYFSDGRIKIELNYLNGRLEGRQIERWFKGGGDTLRSEHNYSGGILHGMQRQWYKDFTPKYNLNFVAGKPDGIQRMWSEAGEVTEERWKNGVLEDVLGAWTAAQPKRVKVSDYVAKGDSMDIILGRVLQKEVHYFETGSISAITLMTDQPETQEFHLGGKLKGKGKGTLDKREGRWEFWHQNGQKMAAGEFVGGKKVGLHESWDEKGNLLEEAVWSSDGSKCESWRVFLYHPNGKKAAEGALDPKGQRTGLWKSWYPDGGKQREETWGMPCASGGRPFISDFSEWDETGKLIRKGSESTVISWKFYPNGDPMELNSTFFPNRDACKPGPVEKFEDGAMKATPGPANYDQSVLLSKVSFFEGGDTLRIDRFNQQGKRDGMQDGFFQGGIKQYSFHYLDGRVQGAIKEWYATGLPMLDYKVQSAIGGPARLVEGTAYSDKGKDYSYSDSEGKEQKKQMIEIEALSVYKKFVEENK
jgi:antitoxin component YwqK of YwqJK toxin-antitoxin module